MVRFFAVFACLSGVTWVALRAVGSHAWQFDAKNLNRFEQGCSLLIVHALLLLLISQMQTQRFLPMRLFAGMFLILGMLLFSGSLIVLSRGGPVFLGQLAPIGGVSFMLAWVCVAIASLKKPTLGK
jgi:uncharacterized membrane protein YgdD (TMEM256/DUF423 family)